MIKALIFDFDGLILETEEPVFQSWQETFREFDCELTFDYWAGFIGTTEEAFTPLDELERQMGRALPRQQILAGQQKREMDLVLERSVLPGVTDYLESAGEMGLKIGVASSSKCAWVTSNLERLGLIHHFDSIRGFDDVSKTKPDPELYKLVLHDFNIRPNQAVVFEDSVNGIAAAKKAGIFCVWIPNKMTSQLSTDQADMRLGSLAELPLATLLEQIDGRPYRN